MMTHRNLYLHAMQVIAGMSVDDSIVQLHTIPLFHVNGWGAPHTITGAGARHVVVKKFDPGEVLELIQRERVTNFSMVPTMANALVNHPSLGEYDLSSLEYVGIGGAASPVDLIREIEQKMGCRAYGGYGLTETTPVLTFSFIKNHLSDLPDEERWRRQAMTGYAMAVVDEEGYFLIVDRKKDIIISGGENISSIEVEKAIYSHPSVFECAVIPVPDDRWGEVPKALVVLKPDRSLDGEELIAHCRSRLPRFKVPKSVEFLDSLPKGGTGKILKKELRERYWQGYDKRVH